MDIILKILQAIIVNPQIFKISNYVRDLLYTFVNSTRNRSDFVTFAQFSIDQI